jgi:hypothetical protein
LERAHPWDYMNAAVDAGYPHVGELGKNVLFKACQVDLQFERILGTPPKALEGTLQKAMDSHLYAVALRGLVKVCDVAAGYVNKEMKVGRAQTAVRKFEKDWEAVRHVRDIEEHPEKYLRGTGRHQRQGILGPSWSKSWTVSRLANHHRGWDFTVSIEGYELSIGRSYDDAQAMIDEVMACLNEMMAAAVP